MPAFFSISLGCPKNRVDTERTLGSLPEAHLVERLEDADIVFINTCGFIAPAIEESIRTIMHSIDDAAQMPKAHQPAIIVAGCLVGRFGQATLAPDLPEVALFLDSKDIAHWAERITTKFGLGQPRTHRLLSTPPSYAWLKISDGCRHRCTFCTIPSIRGPLQSIPRDTLVTEAQHIVASGVKELVLVAQDVTAWGKDFDSPQSLEYLLEGLLPIQGLERLRLMYLYPAGLTQSLLQFLHTAGAPFVPYFDIPLQHASPNILGNMGRPFAGNPRTTIDRVRHVFPDAALRTSIIVGFPGETEEDFDQLCAFVEETRFHHLGVFAYQAEEGTPAASMPEQVPDATKQWRRDSLMELQADISESILAQYEGTQLDVLVDAPQGEWPGLYTGRAWFQAPESDGVCYISGAHVAPGNMVTAEVVETTSYDLVTLAAPDNNESS